MTLPRAESYIVTRHKQGLKQLKAAYYESQSIREETHTRLQDRPQKGQGLHHQQEEPQVQATSGVRDHYEQ